MELDRGLWECGVTHFKNIRNLKDVLRHARGRKKETFNKDYSVRVFEFKDAFETLNGLIGQDLIDGKYKNVIELKKLFEVNGNNYGSIVYKVLISPQDVKDIYTDPHKRRVYSIIAEAVDPFFAKLHEIIAKKEWKFPTEITDNPNKVISGLLIEGYGLFLEDFYKKEGLQRKFVLAFEEVLVLHKPDSKILSDVSDWMRKEEAVEVGTFTSEVMKVVQAI